MKQGNGVGRIGDQHTPIQAFGFRNVTLTVKLRGQKDKLFRRPWYRAGTDTEKRLL